MINLLLLIPVLASFFITLFLLPFWIRKAHEIGLLWEDMNKFIVRDTKNSSRNVRLSLDSQGAKRGNSSVLDYKSGKVSGSGGAIVVLGFVIGVLFYVAYRVFFLSSHNGSLVDIFALLTVIGLLASIGFIDDLFGWKKGGLSIRTRLILVAMASIPLIAINAGKNSISLPFFGVVNLGLIYPLVFIPIGVMGATTTYNFLAGFNGLEAGNGVLILFSLAVISLFTGNSWLSIIALCMVASLFAFLIFNFYPARVFPGDSLTYAVGGLIAAMAILGNFEKIAIFFFIPYVLETVLKIRGKLKKYCFGVPREDGTLGLRYDKIYSLNHLAICLMKRYKIRPTEKRVVFSIWAFQILVILAGFLIFKRGIF